MKRTPIEVFSEWADLDKDFGMEKNHRNSVQHMLEFAVNPSTSFSFIDAGCGNGWVVRAVSKNYNCEDALGIDGSSKMIQKAMSLSTENEFICADINEWVPKKQVDLVHSMEVFYYLEDPQSLIKRVYNHWLKPSGRLIIGLDFYYENKVSHEWPESCGISTMQLFSEQEWVQFFNQAGFQSVRSWRFGKEKNWEGTLIVTGIK